jgi:translation initiation factor 4A
MEENIETQKNDDKSSTEINSFDKMNLKENLLRGIYGYGFESPSIIQMKSIPKIMLGKDIIAQAQSGTGKTGSFVIGTLQQIDERTNGCQAILIAHTRELAQQIYEVCKYISQYMRVKIILCIGGQDIKQTKSELTNDPIILIGTPGRIIDLVNRRYISTRILRMLVIDEADEMLSSSFAEQIRYIIENIPQTAQICLFSATIPGKMLELTNKFLVNPEKILIDRENLTLEGIKQFYINVEKEYWKFETFCDLFDIISVSQTIVYVNTIKRAELLKQQLEDKNFTVSIIHSSMSPVERLNIMRDFRSGRTRILISTDLLSRGIDIQQVSIVINYDLPKNKECYLHRIGRSGRFGRKGIAINFITRNEEKYLYDLVDFYKTEIEVMPKNIQKYLS